MANLTYNIHTGELVVVSQTGEVVVAFTESGFSNVPWDLKQVQKGNHGQAGHIEGAPIKAAVDGVAAVTDRGVFVRDTQA